jgi:hypothetical protein
MTATGCSLTATTATSTTTVSPTPAGTRRYIIEPDYTASQSVIDAFTTRLQSETDQTTLYVGDIPLPEQNLYVLFWSQYLNSDQVEEYQQDPAVSWFFVTVAEVNKA